MNKAIRILWLLNHTTLRRFEVEQFRQLGITEVFCPKKYPYDEGNLSASVDVCLDETLSIPKPDLSFLNQQDWYNSPSGDAWTIANKYFDIAVIGFFPQQVESAVTNFKGVIVLRVFGLAKGYSYAQTLRNELGPTFQRKLEKLGDRFWFATGFVHLKDEEPLFFKKRDCFLPVGLEGKYEPESWVGGDKRIFFVCPRIESSPYFKSIYQKFKEDFSGLGYLIGGAQPLLVNDRNVLGFVPREIHERNMRELRVMFYHSTEPNHIHYHPFEAIRAGMPLVFMAGGILDRFGGVNLPGRCKTIKEARKKVVRILNDDQAFIECIRKSQVCLLEPMKPDNCIEAWRLGFQRILTSLESSRLTSPKIVSRKPRIAVILPVAYRGGTLRGALLLAQAIEMGSKQAGDFVEVVLGHLDDPDCYPDSEFDALSQTIKRRPYKWRLFDQDEAYRAMTYAGLESDMPHHCYQVPDDGIKQFMDCDLWLIVSDRLENPLLPVRPYVLMIYDYLQRYVSLLPPAFNEKLIAAARQAERVFVTTSFTQNDAIQYAGLPCRNICKLPMLAPLFTKKKSSKFSQDEPYFIWTTNLAPHKNHENAMHALRLYYEEYGGALACYVTGVDTDTIFSSDKSYLKACKKIVGNCSTLHTRIKLKGELNDYSYQSLLYGAEFLWHAGCIDNGTFSVIEAAQLGVPALSSKYPAMNEIDAQFKLNLQWMDPYNPSDMAQQLKRMEDESQMLRGRLPSHEILAEHSVEKYAGAYWMAIKDCL